MIPDPGTKRRIIRNMSMEKMRGLMVMSMVRMTMTMKRMPTGMITARG